MIKQVELEKVIVCAEHELSEAQVRTLPADCLARSMHTIQRDLLIQVSGYVLAMPGERVEIHRKWPADWWQAFRRRWFPLWWLYRYPVRYERIDVSKQLFTSVCPHLRSDDVKSHISYLAEEAKDELS